MNIGTNVGVLSSVCDVTVRLKDTRTGESVGSKGFVSGGGMQAREYIFEFNNIYEYYEFVDILLSAKKQLTIQDNCCSFLPSEAVDSLKNQKKVKEALKYYLNTNEENGVVYIPRFTVEKMVCSI